MTNTQRAEARTQSRAQRRAEMSASACDLDEDGCKKPSPYFPITLEFMHFQSRCRALGFDQKDILKLAKGLAERFLEAADHGA
ncbi:hypothetical protein [Mesorhizobium sp.]|uniref:hypothetical protein n=1 Tax=Mesorhizobium sp. TaxID=1871066 RepID=UPI0012085952|nr:hypothetical protein [Mesorhizobium sp.]TIN78348.1 MAG: hypothetical protein E5Y09_13255 [Mesorhizobium sp.]